MATFQFVDRRVELEFPGDIKCSLPLTEDMRDKIKTTAESLAKQTKEMKGRQGTQDDFDELCDITLDAVASILGEEATDAIIAQKENYSFLDCADLFQFVVNEFTKEYIRVTQSYSNQSKNTVQNVAPHANRAQRRHRRREK